MDNPESAPYLSQMRQSMTFMPLLFAFLVLPIFAFAQSQYDSDEESSYHEWSSDDDEGEEEDEEALPSSEFFKSERAQRIEKVKKACYRRARPAMSPAQETERSEHMLDTNRQRRRERAALRQEILTADNETASSTDDESDNEDSDCYSASPPAVNRMSK